MDLRIRGDLPGALEQFQRAAEIDPALPHLHREIGLILIEQRAFQAAADELRLAVRTDPSDFNSRYDLALSLANAGAFGEARREARLLARKKPQWSGAYYGLGHIDALSGDKEGATEAFRVAVDLDPNAWRAWFELGRLLQDSGDREGAIQAFKGAVRAKPDAPAARYRLAVLLKDSGKTESATKEFAAARALQEKRTKGEQAATAYRQGMERLAKEDYAGAVAELQRAAGLRPDFTEIRAQLKEAHEQWGLKLEQTDQIFGAIEHYRDATGIESSAETQNHLGVLQARMGQIEASIESFRAALALDPEFQNARKNLNQALAIKEGQPH